MTPSSRPIRLPMNRPAPRPYRGGAQIERFRRLRPSEQQWAPEDFLASTVTTFGSAGEGLTMIDGVPLRELIAQDPIGFLGAPHVDRFGANPQLLCKLLHTGERLFVHAHPDTRFARSMLGVPTGKTEAWIVLSVDETVGGRAWLGFADEVDSDDLERWFDAQDSAQMLAALNQVELHPGDTLFVPAGVPHAIGAGILLLELQEPADLSVILEYRPFERLGRKDGLLGLDARTALSCITRTPLAAEQLSGLLGTVPPHGRAELFPDAARPFFRAESLASASGAPVDLPARFAVLVVTAGAGVLTWTDGEMAVVAGDVLLVPHGAGDVRLSGDVRGIRCLPPDPEP